MKKQVHSVQLLHNLELSAKSIGDIGGVGTSRVLRQSDAVYQLYLDYLEASVELDNLPLDFSRWLAPLAGMSYRTVGNRLKAGRARATGSKPNRNQAGLVAEMRERETTPVPELGWDSE